MAETEAIYMALRFTTKYTARYKDLTELLYVPTQVAVPSFTSHKPLTEALDGNEMETVTEEMVHGEGNLAVIGKQKPKQGVRCGEQKEETVSENNIEREEGKGRNAKVQEENKTQEYKDGSLLRDLETRSEHGDNFNRDHGKSKQRKKKY